MVVFLQLIAQIQHHFAGRFRKQRLQLMPFACAGEPQLAPGHFCIFREKMRGYHMDSWDHTFPVIHSTGDAVVSYCGITLPALEAEETDDDHTVAIENVEDAQYLTIHHLMTKQHYISFVAFVTSDRFQMVKLYPEGNAQTRMQLWGRGTLHFYCNQHGLFKKKV